MTRGLLALLLGALAVLDGCAAEKERVKPMITYREPQALKEGEAQRKALCARGKIDRVFDVFCGDKAPKITSLAELRAALGIVTITGSPNEGFAMTGHSTSLSTRSVSAINPRILYVVPDDSKREFVSVAFTRGEQFAEIVVRNRATEELTFYLAVYRQACNEAPPRSAGAMLDGAEGGCIPGDLLTEAVESDWTQLDIYIEDDLVNSPLDCLVCHQPDGPGTPKLLRMQEFAPPWNHWFFLLTDGGRAMVADYLRAKGDEPFGGISGEDAYESNPGLLSSTLFFAGSGDQPNAFVSTDIEREVRESAAARGGNQPQDNSVPGESPTWRAIYERAKRGEAISVPYHDVKVTDPAKLMAMSEAYTEYREGRLPREMLPDIRDVYPDDPALLANMGFATEPGLEGEDLLTQACAQCHNDRLDQTLSRARFNVKLETLSREQRELAAARVMLPDDHPGLMPPARLRTLSDEAKRALVDYLMK